MGRLVLGWTEGLVRERLGRLGMAGPELSVTGLWPGPIDIALAGEGQETFDGALEGLFPGDILPRGVQSVEEALLLSARRRRSTVACAESCTGGLIGGALTSLAGSSEVFLGSAVCYSDEAKRKLLSVSAETLAQKGAVSAETARAMARGARDLFGSTLALSVTGVAGPGGGSPEKPVGTVWFGLARAEGNYAFLRTFSGFDRSAIRLATVAIGLEALWRALEGS